MILLLMGRALTRADKLRESTTAEIEAGAVPSWPYPSVLRPLVWIGPRGQPAAMPEELPVIPARYAPVLFGLLLSGFMSLIVSGLSTARALGLVDGLFAAWTANWLASWAMAFPVVLVAAPLVRRVVARLTVEAR